MMIGLNHLNSKRNVFERTPDGGFMTKTSLEPVS